MQLPAEEARGTDQTKETVGNSLQGTLLVC